MTQPILTVTLICALLSGAPALAEPNNESAGSKSEGYLQPDDSWIRVSGRAAETGPETFLLDYPGGRVFVEVDDPSWHFDNTEILDGDHVTVYGKVDKDTYGTTTIEAASIYVEDLKTYVYASSEDEERRDLELGVTTDDTASPMNIAVTGTVTGIGERQFTLDAGEKMLTVDIGQLNYDPLDDVGEQQLEKGSLVTVSGLPAEGTLESRRLIAENIVVMRGPGPILPASD